MKPSAHHRGTGTAAALPDPVFAGLTCPTSRCCRPWPNLKSVWMGAGPVPEILHRALNALAWLVRLRLLPSLYPFAPLMFQAINILSWGEHRGGMFVEIEGVDARGERARRSWHMIAEKDDGPFIPSMRPRRSSGAVST